MQSWDSPGQHLGAAPAGDGLKGHCAAGAPRRLSLETAAAFAQKAPEQPLEIGGALVQAHLTEGRLAGLHHRDHQPEVAAGPLPSLVGGQSQGGGDRLYSRAR